MDLAPPRPHQRPARRTRKRWYILALLIVVAVVFGLIWWESRIAADGLSRSVGFWF